MRDAQAQAKPRAPATLACNRPARASLPPRRAANPGSEVGWARVTFFAGVDEDEGVVRDAVRVVMGVEKVALLEAHLRLLQHKKIVTRAIYSRRVVVPDNSS